MLPPAAADPCTDPAPLRWRAPSARTGIGLAVATLGACGLVTFACLGAFVDQPPRTADVPVQGTAVSIVVLALGVWLIRSVPFLEVDLQRRTVTRGDRVVADLDATVALLLREVRTVVPGTAGGPIEGRSWTVALVQDTTGSEAAGTVVELRRGVRERTAQRTADRLRTALDLPLFVRDADGTLQGGTAPTTGPAAGATMTDRPPTP